MEIKEALSAAGAAFPARILVIKGELRAASLEQAVVPAEIADEFEVRREAGLVQHAPGVAAHRKHSPRLDVMVLVQHDAVRMVGDAAEDHGGSRRSRGQVLH